MEFSYENYYREMNRIYKNINGWPQPYQYQIWFQTLSQEYRTATLHPTYYTQIYTYAYQNSREEERNGSKKLSRGQKKKEKKLRLQEELKRETEAIGKWVKYQRKDLIDDLQKIEKKEEGKRVKKQQKLGHLIQINKEVSKVHRKKNESGGAINRRVNIKKAKKRVSYLKQMKSEFQKNKGKIIGLKKKEQQWESQSEEQEEQQKEKGENQLKQQKKQKDVGIVERKEITEITYSKIGKLTGFRYNQMVLRQWVTNYPSDILNDQILNFVNRIAYKQAMRKAQKPQKAKKLIVSGLKECKRTLTTIIDKKRSKVLIVALNIQRNPYKGGVDDQVLTTIQLAQKLKIPIIHACTRSNLGRAFTGKWGPRLTIISILNFQGYQDMYDQMLQHWHSSIQKYQQL